MHCRDDFAELAGDVADLFNAALDLSGEGAHLFDTSLDAAFHLTHHAFDVERCHGGLCGEVGDFACDDKESQPVFAGLLSFNGSVDGQEIRLVGNLGHGDDDQVDSVSALADLGQLVTEHGGALRQLLHGGIHTCKVGATLFGTMTRV